MTADYTPTTDEVRERYIDFSINLAAAEGATGFLATLYVTDKARADFDRWLAEVRREAAEKAWDEGVTVEWGVGYSDQRIATSSREEAEEWIADDDAWATGEERWLIMRQVGPWTRAEEEEA